MKCHRPRTLVDWRWRSKPRAVGASVSNTTKIGLETIAAAALMGALGDGLLRALPWGLNVPVWIGLLLAAFLALAWWRKVPLNGDGRWLIGPALFFAAAIAWRA